MTLKATKKASDFELAPAGPQPARCYRIIDLGTQETEYQGQKKKQAKVLVSFELLGDERMNDGRPFAISQRYTCSMHEKSILSQHLESWRGKPFSPDERVNFDLAAIAGKYCLINVVHNVGKEGTEYANIATIMPLPKALGKPEGINPIQVFTLDEPDWKLFESLPEKIQDTIKASPEYQAIRGGSIKDMKDDVPWDDDKFVPDTPQKEYEF